MDALVFDTGPLSHFARAGRLDVLEAVVGERRAVIPQAVVQELQVGASLHDRIETILDAAWLEHRELTQDSELLKFAEFAGRLVHNERNVGDAAVLALAAIQGRRSGGPLVREPHSVSTIPAAAWSGGGSGSLPFRRNGTPVGSAAMSICTVEIDVASDLGRTFAYLADAANQAEWRHDVATCELTEGAPGAVGAVYRQANRGQEVDFVITAVEPDVSITWVCAEDTSWPVRGTYRLSDLADGGTRITMDLEMAPTGPFIVFRPFVPLMVKGQRKKYAAGLQAALG